MFLNYLSNEMVDEAVERKLGGWFIKVGFAGFNSPANNRWGYKSKEAAEAAVLKYQNK